MPDELPQTMDELRTVIGQLQGDVAHVKDAVTQLGQSMGRLEKSIIGDEKIGHRGIITRLDLLEGSDKKTTSKLLVWGGIATGAAALWKFLSTNK